MGRCSWWERIREEMCVVPSVVPMVKSWAMMG